MAIRTSGKPFSVPTVLLVGGVDPSGGAGLSSDIIAVAMNGAHPAAVAALVTVQDGRRLDRVEVLSPDLVRSQIERVAESLKPAAVKTGALGSGRMVETVAGALDALGLTRLVVDPVIRSTSGGSLIDSEGIEIFKRLLFPLAELVTPNIPEAEILTGLTIGSVDGMRAAAESLLSMGPRAVLIKGGHLARDPVDLLRTGERELLLMKPRVKLEVSPRGTGCRLASAVAAGLANDLSMVEAVALANDYIQRALEGCRKAGQDMLVPGLGGK